MGPARRRNGLTLCAPMHGAEQGAFYKCCAALRALISGSELVQRFRALDAFAHKFGYPTTDLG